MTDNELKEDCLQESGVDLCRYSHTEMTQIKDALRRYHNAKLKLLSIADVSSRHLVYDNGEEYCEEMANKMLVGLNGC